MPGSDYRKYSNDIIKFENAMQQEYPLGLQDTFKISHGNNYFKFFERFGLLFYQTYYENNILVATCAAVLKNNKIWYIGDLKVHIEWRKKNIPLKILKKCFFVGMLITRKAYSIEMIGQHNNNQSRILKLLYHYKIKNLTIRKLSIYNLSYLQICKIFTYIQKFHRKNMVFLSLKNIKDLILSSTGNPIKLLHLVTIDSIKNDDIWFTYPQPHHTHMVSCFHDDNIDLLCRRMKIKYKADAWIIAHNIDINTELSFINTAEI